MFTWKRLIIGSTFLVLLVIIGWTTWYFSVIYPKLTGKPVTIYNTKSQITTENTSDAASVEKSQREKNTQEDYTVETHKHPEIVSHPEREGAENAAASPTQKESDQHAHSSETHQRSEEELTEWAKELKEIEEFIAGANARLKLLNESREKRLYEKANELNSLSAEEQQAYFDNIRSGNVLEELPPDFFELAKANMLSKGNSEEAIDIVLEGFKQRMQEYASEAGAKRHLEDLRAHGFEPKF